MKKIFLLLAFLVHVLLHAQTNSLNINRTNFSISLDENTVVKNAKGERVPYAVVMKLIATGKFTIDLVKDIHGNATECKLREVKKDDTGKREVYMRIPGTENNPKPEVGNTLHYVDLATMDDKKMLSADDYKGKIVVINFWYSNCKTCINEIPLLNDLASKYKNNSDIIFIAANPDKREIVQEFLKAQSFSYTVCPQATSLIDDLKIQIYPTHLVIGRDGKILNSYSGGLPGIDDVLKKDVEEALKNGLKLVSNSN